MNYIQAAIGVSRAKKLQMGKKCSHQCPEIVAIKNESKRNVSE